MKTVKKLSVILAAFLLCAMVLAPAAAFADTDTTYTPGTGTNTKFQKALVLNADANVPGITFAYTIEAGAAVAAGNGKMEILSPGTATGVTGTPTIADVTFTAGGAAVSSADGVTLTATRMAAVATATVDFSGVSFSEPGIYRYLIKETSAGQQGVTYDTQLADKTNGVAKQRTLDVYVTDDNGSLVVSSYVIHELVNDIGVGEDAGSAVAATLADKSKGFVNEYATFNFAFAKAVSGNQASHDKYFKFSVAITNGGANALVNVDMSAAQTAPAKSAATAYEASTMAAANALDEDSTLDGQQWKLDADGAVTKDLYLKHGQTVTIKGLAKGANVTVTETPEDYKCDKSGNKIEVTNMEADSLGNTFTNTRSGIIPTGVLLTVVPGVAIVAIALVGLFVMKKKKNEA